MQFFLVVMVEADYQMMVKAQSSTSSGCRAQPSDGQQLLEGHRQLPGVLPSSVSTQSAGVKEFQVSTAAHASPLPLIVVMRRMGSWCCLSVTERLLVFVALKNGKKCRSQGMTHGIP